MSHLFKSLLAGLVAALCAFPVVYAEAMTGQQRAAAGFTEEAFLGAMAIDGYKEVRYLDEDGKPLRFDQFMAATQSGRSFSKEAQMDRSLAVLKLKPQSAARAEVADEWDEPKAGKQALHVPAAGKVPALTHKDLAGNAVSLADGVHYTLLSFFFADCVPCIQEVPALNALATTRIDLKVVSVTFEHHDDAAEFVHKRGLKTTVVADAQDYIDALGVKVYPTLALVSPEGRLMGVRSAYKVADHKDGGLAELEAWMASLGLAP